MGTITRQLLIWLVIAFFICGLHSRSKYMHMTRVNYPAMASCESDEDCVEGGNCIRRQCYCPHRDDIGDGKIKCERWYKCRHQDCLSSNSHCLKHPSIMKYFCKCNPGFIGLDGKPGGCVRTDKSEYTCVGDFNCVRAARCNATRNRCICKDGLTGDGEHCSPGPLHPCQADKDCHPRARCDIGKCFCQGNSTGNGKYCRTSLPCPAEHQCHENSTCVVDPLIPDKPHCVCLDGFRKTVDGKCVEITQCFREQGEECPFGQICGQDSDGFYECICHEGQEVTFSEGKSICQDADECSDPEICQANSVCVNTEGSYRCECSDGYTENDNDVCQDVDECSENADACDDGEKCENSQGGYFCGCEQGYLKKNGTCVKDECNNCKKHEECYEGKCKCKKSYKKNKHGHCVSRISEGLRGGSARVSGYLSTFILGVLGSLALSA